MSGATARAKAPTRDTRRRQSSAGPGLPWTKTTASSESPGPACRYRGPTPGTTTDPSATSANRSSASGFIPALLRSACRYVPASARAGAGVSARGIGPLPSGTGTDDRCQDVRPEERRGALEHAEDPGVEHRHRRILGGGDPHAVLVTVLRAHDDAGPHARGGGEPEVLPGRERPGVCGGP